MESYLNTYLVGVKNYRPPGVINNFNNSRHAINVLMAAHLVGTSQLPLCKAEPERLLSTALRHSTVGGWGLYHVIASFLKPSIPVPLPPTAAPHSHIDMCDHSDPCVQLLFPLNSTLTVPSLGSREVSFSSLPSPVFISIY